MVVIGTAGDGISSQPQCSRVIVVVRQVAVGTGQVRGCATQTVVYVVEMVVGLNVSDDLDEDGEDCAWATDVVEPSIAPCGSDCAVALVGTEVVTVRSTEVVDSEATDDEAAEIEVELEDDPTSGPVALYTVIRTTVAPSSDDNCLRTNLEGSSATPPHFWDGSPGHGVLQAESGYWTKSESAGLPWKLEQKHCLTPLISSEDLPDGGRERHTYRKDRRGSGPHSPPRIVRWTWMRKTR